MSNSFSFILFSFDTPHSNPESLKKPIVLEGYRIPDLVSLHKVLKKELKLPSYSEPNLDSLDEILNDPDWLELNSGICIDILNYPQFLHLESPARKKSMLTILNSFSSSLGYAAIFIQNCDQIQNELYQLNFSYQTYSQ